MPRCEAITTKGTRCSFQAQENSKFCGLHQEEFEGGRPTKFDCIDIGQIEILASYGLTDEQMANVFGVSLRSFENYKKKHEQFLHALKKGKSIADANTEKSLYHRAIGYTVQAEKIFHYKGKPVRVEHLKHFPPDTAAAFIWLKNRRPDRWKDRREYGVSVEDERGTIQALMDKLDEEYEKQKNTE